MGLGTVFTSLIAAQPGQYKILLYWDSHQLYICLQIGVGISAVPTTDTVTTGDLSIALIVQFNSALPGDTETNGQGMRGCQVLPLTNLLNVKQRLPQPLRKETLALGGAAAVK